MPEQFTVSFTAIAEANLRWFSAYSQRIILDGVELHLQHQPMRTSRRIKSLRPNPIAGWELRLGDYRVLFDVDKIKQNVIIQIVGEKRGNRLLVQGKEYAEHEGN
jgi:mRNA-degrading endonuclease RelE of RelBE toxin-antitoxin system